MPRTVWFSLICLIGIVGLISVKPLLPLVFKKPVKVIERYGDDDELPLAFKTDKLPENADEIEPRKIPIQTLKIAPDAAASKEDVKPAAKEKWRPTYARMRGARHFSERHHRRLKPR